MGPLSFTDVGIAGVWSVDNAPRNPGSEGSAVCVLLLREHWATCGETSPVNYENTNF